MKHTSDISHSVEEICRQVTRLPLQMSSMRHYCFPDYFHSKIQLEIKKNLKRIVEFCRENICFLLIYVYEENAESKRVNDSFSFWSVRTTRTFKVVRNSHYNWQMSCISSNLYSMVHFYLKKKNLVFLKVTVFYIFSLMYNKIDRLLYRCRLNFSYSKNFCIMSKFYIYVYNSM